MTTCEAWRWVAHHWAYGMLRFVVLGAGMVSTVVKAPCGKRRDQGSTPCGGSTCMRLHMRQVSASSLTDDDIERLASMQPDCE